MREAIDLPPALEQLVKDDVQSGRSATVEDAILQRIIDSEVPPPFMKPMTREELRRDLEEARANREGAVDGRTFFENLLRRRANPK